MCTGLELFLIGSTVVSAGQQISQGRQAKQASEFQQAQAMADAQAERQIGEVKAEKVRKAGRAQQSEARAALSASGVEIDAGTPVRIGEEIARRNEEDALQEILYGSRKGARLDQEGMFSSEQGKRAERAGYMSAFGSVLSSGATYYGSGWKGVRPQQAPAPVEDRYVPRLK